MRLPSSSPLRELKYALWFPAYLLAYALAEHLVTTRYWATELPVDNCIPFSQSGTAHLSGVTCAIWR